jgi:type III secretory pathway lipoprotein EscJ
MLLLSACREEVVHGVDESRANRIVAALESLEIDANKKREADGGWTIVVSQQDASRAIRTLSDRRLLPNERAVLDGGDGMLPSREGQSFRLERKMSAGIEDTLRSLRGVLDARVHLNLGVQRDVFDPRGAAHQRRSASVLLIVTPEYSVPVTDTAALVGQASGVPAEAVAVVHSVEGAVSSPKETVKQVVSQSTLADLRRGPFLTLLVGGLLSLAAVSVWCFRRRASAYRLAVSPPVTDLERA